MLNLKKFATLLMVLCSVSVVSTAFLVPAVHATSGAPNPCYDITDKSSPVLVPDPGGVANSGIIFFDPPIAPDTQYEACVTDSGDDGIGMFEVKGWAWDDNLGWVSFYCGDENLDGATPYENLGISCGDQKYGVQMEGNGEPNPGRLHGYAYGDNTGWINFSCIAGKDSLGGSCESGGPFDYYVEAETTDTACLGEVYSTVPPAPGCFANDIKSTFAFSDNVGWIDLKGVQFPWIELISAAVKVDFEILMPDGITPLGSTVLDKNNSAVGDSTDGYTLRLHVAKLDGTAIDPAKYTIVANVTWDKDTVDITQTDGSNADCKALSSGPACAVRKPLSIGDFAVYNPLTTSFDVKVTSAAPTTGVDGYDKNADGTVDFSYENFVLGGTSVPANSLTLGDVKVSVMTNPGGICAFGDTFGGCNPKSVLPSSRTLEFLPAVELNELNDAKSDFTISAQYGVANTINYSTVCRGIFAGDCSPGAIDLVTGVDSPFVMIYTPTSSDPSLCTGSKDFSLSAPSGGSFLLTSWFAESPPGTCPTGSSAETGTNAYVYSTVSYINGGKSVSYYSNKLPRVEGTLVVNPVAEVRGSVYSTGVSNPSTGKTVRSIGDVSTNLLRDTLFRNVSNIIAGVGEFSGDATVGINTDELSFSGFTVSNPLAVKKLLPDAGGIPKVYYFRGNVTLDEPLNKNILWSGERTLIVVGGNVYINSNLYNPPVAGVKPKLGIIVLKDLSDTSANQAKQGHVYIAPSVKNIQANIFADGSVFSYDGVGGLTAAGEPIFSDEAARYNALLNQLYIEGSVASQNTVGGASSMPLPILGNGQTTVASEGNYGNNPTGRSQARLYDLNFLRYYGLVLERRPSSDPTCPDQPVDQQFLLECPGDLNYSIDALHTVADGGDLVLNPGGLPAEGLNPATDLSAVYISFDPPPATLPGFGVSSGVSETVRAQ